LFPGAQRGGGNSHAARDFTDAQQGLRPMLW
jgi:hypothetical protein